jgi:hypothetical protein
LKFKSLPCNDRKLLEPSLRLWKNKNWKKGVLNLDTELPDPELRAILIKTPNYPTPQKASSGG